MRLSPREVSAVLLVVWVEEMCHMAPEQICQAGGHQVSLELEQDEQNRGLGRPSLAQVGADWGGRSPFVFFGTIPGVRSL